MHFIGLTKSRKDYVPGVEPLPTPEPDEIPKAVPLITMEKQSEDLASFIRILQLPQVHLVSECKRIKHRCERMGEVAIY